MVWVKSVSAATADACGETGLAVYEVLGIAGFGS
ncbi:hypothetical protein MKAN_23780 [Mycobacterium kansasii ATCC 12478]|uniref:Uncharacterized protein n=1 Tax=Mycobacterium kansasii ATCC 12478 TaxID=557599 RepID=U5WZ69_MYCKA|nr:hypothetical protein MKAN_23780 [Mycobacterium kansasii ATCC 12478]